MARRKVATSTITQNSFKAKSHLCFFIHCLSVNVWSPLSSAIIVSINLVKRFKDLGIPCFEPFGAFYIFPNISQFGLSSEEFAMRLVEEERLAVVPGTAFGDSGEGFLRISYAYSIEDLKTALDRIEHFITKLRNEK